MRFFVAVAALASVVSVMAAEITVVVGKDNGLAFDPPFVTAQQGDIVAFQFVSKNHTATQSTFANPCQRMTTPSAGVDSGFIPVAPGATSFPQWSITVNNASAPLWFYCAQGAHCTNGMVFAINPTAERTYQAFLDNATGRSSGSPSTSPSAASPTPSNGASRMGGASSVLVAGFALAVGSFIL